MEENINLPAAVLDWVINQTDPKAVVESVDQLKGSTSSTLHSVSLKSEGQLHPYVVRQFDNREWLSEEPDLALHEAECLQMANYSGVVTPRLIAYDEKGHHCGVPAVLMTQLEGEVDLKPEQMDEWLQRLADALVRLHGIPAENFPYLHKSYNNISSFGVPYWTNVSNTWKKAINLLKAPRPNSAECFIHRDYHPANVLWTNGSVSGVVDWPNGCKGPRGVDVGHCRVNLAMLWGVEAADEFLTEYRKQAGSQFTYEPYWDLLSVADMLVGPPEVYPGWEAFGMTGLTNDMMKERLDQYVVSLMEKANA
ncbi:phosphotransferase family protein [Virgibacillus siamensis]|uniref:phosphotransferase family protein n=1 Tax=Virgibacillus siamensis TaxID=480071 RepID=UPI0009844473|nr:aminoglycoside phosphotransferase family protein [Virgibacillus siamensis]